MNVPPAHRIPCQQIRQTVAARQGGDGGYWQSRWRRLLSPLALPQPPKKRPLVAVIASRVKELLQGRRKNLIHLPRKVAGVLRSYLTASV